MSARRSKPTNSIDSARERILDAALDTFAKSGFDGATTKEIARKAEVNEVTIFRQFKSKRALFNTAFLERSILVEAKKSVSFDARQPLEQLLFQNAKSVLKILRAHKQLFMVALGDAWRQPTTKGMAPGVVVQKGVDYLATFLQSLMDAGKMRRTDPKIAARMIMGAMQFYFLTTDLLRAWKPSQIEEDRILRGFVDIFLNGMKAEQKGVSE